jgi:type IV pilus assembly protein PilB
VEGRGQRLRKKLGELLVEAGLVSKREVQEALEEQQKTGKRLGQILVERGSVSKGDLGRVLQTQTGFPYVSLTAQPLDREVVGLVPESLVRRFRAIPIAREGNELIVAMADPTDLMAIDELSAASGFRIRPVLTTESDLEWAIAQLFDVRRQVEEAVEAAEGEDLGRTVQEEAVLTIEEDRDTSPVIRMVNSIIRGAISAGATDIHFEPQPGGLRVRYRIDGMLYDKASIPQTMQAAVVSRIKVMAGLNIAERVKPQDGRISLRVDGAEYDVRVATIGCTYGERVVLRLLDKHRILLGLDRLGLLPDQQELVTTLIRKPW